MADFPLDESDEINRLWAKVGASPSEPDAFLNFNPAPDPQAGQQIVRDAVALLKRRHSQEEGYWSEVLTAKERALAMSKERQARLELELSALRARLQIEDASKLQQTAELEAQMRAVHESLEADRKRYEDEIRGLRALLDQARQRVAADTARTQKERQGWESKEQQYLIELAEYQALTQRLREESSQSAQQGERLSASLKEAKNAIEKTLSELLRERQLREETDKEKTAALRKVEEVQKHFEELSRLWEEERAQWRELWDRERSTWESQRSEFAQWEENLRKEREQWLSEVKAKEQDQLRFTDEMTRTLRLSAEATSKMTSVTRAIQEAAQKAPFLPAPVWRAMALAAAMLAVAYPAWRYASRYHFKEVSALALPAGNPTALGYDGALIWTADWDGTLKAFDPQNPQAPARTVALGVAAQPYRPVGLAFDGEYLWTADASQARILRQRAANPDQIVSARPSPGPAPTALAFDGQALWSYDAANKALYRHGVDESSAKAYSLDPDVVVTAMAWVQGELWVFDSKSKALMVFRFKDENFHFTDRYTLPDAVTGLAVAGLTNGRGHRLLWVLSASPRGTQLERYAF